MKSQLSILFVIVFSYTGLCQNKILYDLDSYKRVIGAYRTTFITPDVNLQYQNVLNTPEQNHFIGLNVGGRYDDNQIINDVKNQKTKYTDIDFGVGIGTIKNVDISYNYRSQNRSYNGMKYFKSGFEVSTINKYIENTGLNAKRFTQNLNVSYDLGFGFGRLEIVNNAWLGARILEELQVHNLLMSLPQTDELTEFFDHIGDLEFERVMDPRLRTIFRVENIIEFIEDKGWIEKGSIPSFVKIYDAFRFEQFVFRESGERLAFTLVPTFKGSTAFIFQQNNQIDKILQPGFLGKVEYEIHKNGDLAYNTTQLVGGEIGYFEIYRDEAFEDYKQLTGNVYFQYRYKYLPSLRTNLILSSIVFAGFIYNNSYNARLSASTSAEYNYYFSPATRLVMEGMIAYVDSKFQIGEYQPKVDATFSLNIVHAIR